MKALAQAIKLQLPLAASRKLRERANGDTPR